MKARLVQISPDLWVNPGAVTAIIPHDHSAGACYIKLLGVIELVEVEEEPHTVAVALGLVDPVPEHFNFEKT